jgi:hypothetical protein
MLNVVINDIQQKDTQHDNKKVTLRIAALSLTTLDLE